MVSDERLMEQAAGGSREALTILVERHYASLFAYLYYATNGQRALAEDFAQETFTRLVKNAASYKNGSPIKPWLYSIATNLTRDFFRRSDTQKTDSWTENLDENTGQTQAEPEAVYIRAEWGRNISSAMMKLSQPLRTTLILRFFDDLSLNEISQVLSIPVGTVKSRLSNALHQLRHELEGEPREEME